MKNNDFLVLDEEDNLNLSKEEYEEIQKIQRSFIKSYIVNKDKMNIEEWLTSEIKINLPEIELDKANEISSEIVSTIKIQEEKKESLNKAVESGRGKEGWLASEIKQATSLMTSKDALNYLNDLDVSLKTTNSKLYNSLLTQNSVVNQNPNLDGFIAEHYHVDTFNLNAKASGSSYRAKVLEPIPGETYRKNSVDIVILDSDNKIVKKYQSKYCKDVNATIESFKNGDYRGQRKLVASGQELEITNASSVIEAPDGTQSKSLSKQEAKNFQNDIQNGKFNEYNWNDYKVKDLAVGITKQAGYATLQGVAMGAGFSIASSLIQGKEVETDEVVEAALKVGMDSGIKEATAGAIKVGVEKGIISIIPKGTSVSTIANIAHVAVENVKIMKEIGTGELTFKEGIEKMERTTVSTIAGIAASAEGAAVGAAIGTIFGPVGTAVGAFVGGVIGYAAGSKVGETVVKVAQTVREGAKMIVREVYEGVKEVKRSISEGISNFCNEVGNSISSFFGW